MPAWFQAPKADCLWEKSSPLSGQAQAKGLFQTRERQLKQEKMETRKLMAWCRWWHEARDSSRGTEKEAEGRPGDLELGSARAGGPDGSITRSLCTEAQGIWHTRLLFHSTDDDSLLSEAAAKKKEVVLPWGRRGLVQLHLDWQGPCSGQFVGPFLPVPYPAAQV